MIPKIDSFTHYASPNLMEYLASHSSTGSAPFQALFDQIPILTCSSTSDVQDRVSYMKKAGVVCQVLIPLPWIEACPTVWADSTKAARACRIANEEMAKFCSDALEREDGCCFVGVALLPSVNEEVMMQEYNYAIQKLKLAGSVLFFGPQTTPSDDPLFETLYRESEKNSTPIWLHPSRAQSYPDYDKYLQQGSMHAIWNSLGWVYDTSVAMVHIAISGVLQRYPSLKIVGHHGGGMIPFFTERFSVQTSNFGSDLEKQKFEDLKKFYVDTATFGYQPLNVRQCLEFFDEGRVLYGTDTPMVRAINKSAFF